MKHKTKMETLYQEVLSDIRFAKNQQWLITTYAVGILAFLSSLFDNLMEIAIKSTHSFHLLAYLQTWCKFSIFAAIQIIVTIFGVCYVLKYSKDVKKGQKRKLKLLKSYLLDYYLFLSPKKEKDKITPLLIGVIIATGFIIFGYSFWHWLI